MSKNGYNLAKRIQRSNLNENNNFKNYEILP